MIAKSVQKNPLGFNVETRVSTYDLWNAWMLSVILFATVVVTGLFLLWLNGGLKFLASAPHHGLTPVIHIEPETGMSKDFAEPGAEEMPELETPQFATDLVAVEDAVSTVVANESLVQGDAKRTSRGDGHSGREPSFGPPMGPSLVPEYRRWIIRYECESIDQYARQLSFFGIDIGVVQKEEGGIFRLHDPANWPTVIESNRDTERSTLRFMHKKQSMQRWDATLAKRQEMDLENTFTCQFYPEETRILMRQAESVALHSADRLLADVKNTVLKITDSGDGFVFVVEDIVYH